MGRHPLTRPPHPPARPPGQPRGPQPSTPKKPPHPPHPPKTHTRPPTMGQLLEQPGAPVGRRRLQPRSQRRRRRPHRRLRDGLCRLGGRRAAAARRGRGAGAQRLLALLLRMLALLRPLLCLLCWAPDRQQQHVEAQHSQLADHDEVGGQQACGAGGSKKAGTR